MIDFERIVSQGGTNSEAIEELRSQPDCYCPAVLAALNDAVEIDHSVKIVKIADFCEGMILDEDLVTLTGDLLLARGNEIQLEPFAND